MELYKKHRPTDLNQVVGQDVLVLQLQGMLERKRLPHAIMLVGPSGCGKTTIARILREELGCGDNDFFEINAAESRGIDDVRSIQSRMGLAPMAGRCRVYLIDEAHKLTGDAQNALLKTLEDTPRHVYFILCTTDDRKIIATIRTRCTEFAVKSVADADMRKMLTSVCKVEKLKLSPEVITKLIEAADGSPRKALVLLDQVSGAEDEETALRMIESADAKNAAIDIARKLINPQTTWKEMAATLKALPDEDPEGIRHLVLSYCQSILLNGRDDARVFLIMEEFARNFWDTKRPGLVMACYAVISSKKR